MNAISLGEFQIGQHRKTILDEEERDNKRALLRHPSQDHTKIEFVFFFF